MRCDGMNTFFDKITVSLQQWDRQGRRRTLEETAQPSDAFVVREGRTLLNLASNRYLGALAVTSDEKSGEGTPKRKRTHGGGAGSSRLIVGTDEQTLAFECAWAQFKGTEACLMFGSGYAANVGVVAALADRHTVVFSDRLNHASIIDGVVLARAQLKRYRHGDVVHLEQLLAHTPPHVRKWIITDAVFSMDGTVAPLPQLVALAKAYGAALMVDEAHSGGVFGDEGQGLVHAMGLTDDVDVIMGTFSKAYDSYGAYVAGRADVIDYLVHTARSFMYSTALPPLVVAMTTEHVRRAQKEAWRRLAVQTHAQTLRTRLVEAGFSLPCAHTPWYSGIVPIVVGDNGQALRFAHELQQVHALCAVAIRPPTVPERTARVRLSLMATHTEEQMCRVAEALVSSAQRLHMIP